MSTNRPPQLRLSLHTENGTSFKRSFEQFGFDLDAPVSSMGVGGSSEAGGSGSSGSGNGSGNERNKRARSQNSFSDSDETADSSASSEVGTAQSSQVNIEARGDTLSGLSATRATGNVSSFPSVLVPFPGPPRMPSPEPQDIEMSVLEESRSTSTTPVPSTASLDPAESYRISLERFNAFDNEISALRQSPSRSPTPPLPRVHDNEYAGLQVFELGELHMSQDGGDSRDGPSRYRPVLDVFRLDPATALNRGDSRETSQPRMSALNSDSGIESHSPVRDHVPSTLPRLSPSPLFSQEDMQRWSSQLPNDDTSNGPPSRFRADVPPRATPDYMPPRDWFDMPLPRERPRGNPLLDAHTTASDIRGAVYNSRGATLRRMAAESSGGESPVLEFSSAAQIARGRERGMVESFRQGDQSSGSNEERRGRHPAIDQELPLTFSRVDWSPFERPVLPPAGPRPRYGSHARTDQTYAEIFEDEDVRIRVSERPSRLSRIETSDYDLSPPSFDHYSSALDPPRTSFDSGDNPVLTNSVDSQRQSENRTPTPSMFIRRPISPPSNANSFARSSTNTSRLTSIADSRRADSPDPAWPMTQAYPGDEAFRQPSHSRFYNSHPSLVAENAAELRRRLARSQMLQNITVGARGQEEFNNEDHWNDGSNTMDVSGGPDISSPLRADHIGGPWIRPSVHARLRADNHSSQTSDSALRNRSANPLLRASDWSTRGLDDRDYTTHRFDPLTPSSNTQFVGGVTTHDRDSAANGLRAAAQASGRVFVTREIPQRGRTFPSGIDSTREISSARWEADIHSAEYTALPMRDPASGLTDMESRAQARFRRSSLADADLFQSPSPPLVERAPREPVEPPRTMPPPAYGNLDLSAYHEGPFRASLQRYVDLDRRRSRSNRLEHMADDVTSNPMPSSSPHSPPTIPPLRFDSDERFSTERTFRQAANPARQPASSPVIDPEHRYLRHVRGPFPGTPGSQGVYNHNNNVDGNGIPREIDVRDARGRLARIETNTGTNVRNPTSGLYSWEDRNMAQRARFNAYDARMQTHWNQTYSEDLDDGPPDSRLIPASSTRPVEPDLQAQNARLIRSRVIGIQARIREHIGAQSQTRMDAPRTNNSGVNDFGQAMNSPGADGLSTSTQRGFLNQYQINRYQSERAADFERLSAADNDIGGVGSRYLSARARYARRGRLHRPSQPLESSVTSISGGPITSTRQHHPSSHSPPLLNNNSERSGAAAVLADRASRLRTVRERMHRERELMRDSPRYDYPHRAGRNLGDYVRDEDFDSSYENLLHLASTLGEVRPRATPNHIIAALPTGSYKDWQTVDSDQRCPICLDDYKPLDPVLKLSDCSHWLHKSCLEQWLRTANTCPVCRKGVKAPRHPHQHADQDPSSSGNRHHGGSNTQTGGFSSSPVPWRWE